MNACVSGTNQVGFLAPLVLRGLHTSKSCRYMLVRVEDISHYNKVKVRILGFVCGNYPSDMG